MIIPLSFVSPIKVKHDRGVDVDEKAQSRFLRSLLWPEVVRLPAQDLIFRPRSTATILQSQGKYKKAEVTN